MLQGRQSQSTRAAVFLAAATLFWALSFPLMRALGLLQATLAPGASTIFLSAISLLARFSIAALTLALWRGRNFATCTRLELWQGLGLGVFGGIGILFQMDGVIRIDASVSAFLTQCYCIWVPLVVALRHRVWPSRALAVSCLMVLVGVGVLARLDISNFRLGRGEAETILASLFFTGQILLLEIPAFAGNRAVPVTLVMFAVNALMVLPVAVVVGHGWVEWKAVFSTNAAIGFTAILGTFCSVVPYTIMNRWQQHLAASHASLLYAFEPLFACLFSVFVPAWLAHYASVNYPNETIGPHLLIGGGLVIAANLLVLWRASSKIQNREGRAPASP